MIFTKSIKNLKETRKQNEVDKLIITPAVINKPAHKVIVLRSPEKNPTTELKIQVTPVVRKAIRKTIVLPPTREERLQQAQYPIFVRYVNEATTKKDFQDLINDAALQSVYVAKKEATLTFMTQESADKAVELINNTKLHGNQLRAVPNYKSEVRVQQKTSIFDRIQK